MKQPQTERLDYDNAPAQSAAERWVRRTKLGRVTLRRAGISVSPRYELERTFRAGYVTGLEAAEEAGGKQMDSPERVYLAGSQNEANLTEYVRGDIVEEIRQQGRDAASLAQMAVCVELGEDGRPGCDPPCIVCRYSQAAAGGE